MTVVAFPQHDAHGSRRPPGCMPRSRVARAVTAQKACEHCDGTNRLAAHHRIPRAQGGPAEPGNLEVACIGCHNRVKPKVDAPAR